jgi:peptidoglycan/LPS O-acetylase OafA/YrhL
MGCKFFVRAHSWRNRLASYQKPQRLEYLDSIRGLAALAVLLSHSFLFQPPPRLDRFLLLPFINIPFNGKEAVMMFFVLSGFLLSRPYFVAAGPEQGVRRIYPPTFYLRRFTRIWLPWFFAFCLSAVAQVTIFREWRTVPPQSAGLHSLWQVPLTAGNFIWQCLFMLHDPRVQLLNQDWSLGVELKASIALPLFIFLAGGRWCMPRRVRRIAHS